jgi:hypothetical protein
MPDVSDLNTDPKGLDITYLLSRLRMLSRVPIVTSIVAIDYLRKEKENYIS